MTKPQYRVPFTLALLAVSLVALPALAQTGENNNPLLEDQVACNETQLQSLLQRLDLDPAGSNNPNPGRDFTLFVSYSNQFGFYEGLAVSNQTPLRAADASGGAQSAEHFLAFHLNPSIRSFLTNPARTPLSQVSLEREESSSNLVSQSDPNALSVTFNPTLDLTGTDGLLEINNLQASGPSCSLAQQLATKPGRGLVAAGLTTNCHTVFTDFDRAMFALLQRVVRVQVGGPFSGDAEVAIYRAEDPATYRVDVYPLNNQGQANAGKLALELTVDTTPQGGLTGGQIRALPECAGGQTSACTSTEIPIEVYLFPPVFGGSQVRLSGGTVFLLDFEPGSPSSPVNVSWSALLAGTAWEEGF
ncbi:MAG TPA: hypothetical protein VL025_12580 [Thermoanaerobaculia bacterium]|nr:hypothetical protein [Thermoanaerobaculia bacterium]